MAFHLEYAQFYHVHRLLLFVMSETSGIASDKSPMDNEARLGQI